MVTLDKEFGTFYTIFMKARNISKELNDDVKFVFNGVKFIVEEDSPLPRPYDVDYYIKTRQNKKVRL